MAQWRTLTRDDLRAFDEDMTKSVLYAMECGGTGRISNNGHAIIRNQQGQTMSVSRSASGGRRKQNVARDLVRLFGEQEQALKATGTDTPVPPLPLPPPTDTPTLPCLAKGCTATFVTEGARYSHTRAEHHPCREPGCDFVGVTAKGEAGHFRIVHQGARPATGRKSVPERVREGTPVETVPTRPALTDATLRKEAEASVALDGETQPVNAGPPTEADVGRTVRQLRQERGWTQTDLAQRMKARGLPVHQTTIAKLENAERPTRLNELTTVADVLGVTLGRLLGHEPADVVHTEARHHDAEHVLERVREALGEDPRIAALQADVTRLTQERDDALAQLALVKEALRLA